MNKAIQASETIKAATIARVTEKTTGKFLGWAVKSNSSSDYYHIHCYKINGELLWTCDCKAGQHGFTNCRDGKCCHVKAVIEAETERKARQAERKAAEAEQIVAQPVQIEQKTETGKYHTRMFNQRGASVYVSDEEMNALKARVAARQDAQSQARAIVEARFAELLKQRDEARKTGGFCLLAA